MVVVVHGAGGEIKLFLNRSLEVLKGGRTMFVAFYLLVLATLLGVCSALHEAEIVSPCPLKSKERLLKNCATTKKVLEFRVFWDEDAEEEDVWESEEDDDDDVLAEDDFSLEAPTFHFYLDGHLIRKFDYAVFRSKKGRLGQYRYLLLQIENMAIGRHKCEIFLISSVGGKGRKTLAQDSLDFSILEVFDAKALEELDVPVDSGDGYGGDEQSAAEDDEFNRSMVEIVYPTHGAWVSHHNVIVRFNLDDAKIGKGSVKPRIFVDGTFHDAGKLKNGVATIDMNAHQLLVRNLEVKKHNASAYLIDTATNAELASHHITFFTKLNPRYSAHAGVFSKEECRKIIALAKKSGFKDATVGEENNGNGQPNARYRKAKVSFLNVRSEASRWVYERLENVAKAINGVNWRFKLGPSVLSRTACRMMETIQVMKYTGTDGGFYDFHIDSGLYTSTAFRKLSLTVQLSSSTAYDGGRLILKYGREDETMPTQRGTGVLFPSYILHRVTPVERGTRYALVTWFRGCESYE